MNGTRAEEVVIVGGGLAGSSAACILARAGHQALLLERDPEPRHKVCGEFLSIEAQTYLANLGIDLDRLGASRISRLRLFHRGHEAEVALPFVARGLSRKVLDEALLQQAISLGARVSRGAAAKSISAQSSFSRIAANPLGEICADTVLVATGKHDVRGVRRKTAGSMNDLIGFKAHYRVSDGQRAALAGSVEIILFTGGYAGLQMIEQDIANLCLVVPRRRFDEAGKSWDNLIDRISGECPHLADRLQKANMLFAKPLAIFQIPYGFLHQPDPTEPQGLFRLGDQAGVIPSFTGEGMSMALHSGCLAASIYLQHGRASSVFHRRMREDTRHQVRFAFMLNKAARQGIGQEVLFHLCRTWPSLMRHVASFTRVQETSMQRALALP
jgi:flavin-dependent dehydrogenase